MLENITVWYKNPEVRIGALIGWGGVGKSALVRKWYDTLPIKSLAETQRRKDAKIKVGATSFLMVSFGGGSVGMPTWKDF